MSDQDLAGQGIAPPVRVASPRFDIRKWGLVAAPMLALVFGAPSFGESRTETLNLSQYRGKVVYLDFWASWCGPCKLSFPYMERLGTYFPKGDFVIVAVNVDHSREKADAFLDQLNASVPVVYDPKGSLAAKYRIKEMPTSVLIDKSGQIRYVHQGFFMSQVLTYESHIAELINEKQ